jgi:mannose/fructose/N-acetylgalactosamine-specific phosphotransferase system component IIB
MSGVKNISDKIENKKSSIQLAVDRNSLIAKRTGDQERKVKQIFTLNDLKVTAMNQERILEMISEFQTLKKKEVEKTQSQKY